MYMGQLEVSIPLLIGCRLQYFGSFSTGSEYVNGRSEQVLLSTFYERFNDSHFEVCRRSTRIFRVRISSSSTMAAIALDLLLCIP